MRWVNGLYNGNFLAMLFHSVFCNVEKFSLLSIFTIIPNTGILAYVCGYVLP